MSVPGLVYAAGRIESPELSDELFNKWYNEEHLPEVLSLPGGPQVAFRFKNVNPTATFSYLALYPLPDLSVTKTDALANLKLTHPMLPGSGNYRDLTVFDMRFYEKIQTFEGPTPKEGRAKCVIAVAMEPGPGEDDDFDQWYRKQHLDMLSMISTYRRSTRYKLVESPTAKEGDELPRYLALHEYDSTEIPVEQMKIVVGTEWSRKIVQGSKAFVRDIWAFIHEEGDKDARL